LKNSKIQNICIIGAGTYGSYIANILSKYPNKFNITILEVGGSRILNENEIGYSSNNFEIENKYAALSKGRYFGFGGSSSKWGGQLLFFDDYDFNSPNIFLNDLVEINKKYKSKVLERFGILSHKNSEIINSKINNHYRCKNGVWLSYFKRNLFKFFKINRKSNVNILSNSRVRFIELENKKINKVSFVQNKQIKSIEADYFFLTTGAFETSRILIDSGIVNSNTVEFSDHFSTKLFEINGPSKIGDFDFTFKFNNDYSLSTNRLLGEIDNLSYFIHPIFNQNFQFFQNLKNFLFKGQISYSAFRSILFDFPSVIKFIYKLLFKKELYVHQNNWYLQIDIESHTDKSTMLLSNEFDKFGFKTFRLNKIEDNNLTKSVLRAKEILKDYLIVNNINFKEINADATSLKLEDTYHPYNINPVETTIDEYYSKYANLLIINTGILPRVGGLNPTASLFPLIEDFISKNLLD
jgi:hypothetical protein